MKKIIIIVLALTLAFLPSCAGMDKADMLLNNASPSAANAGNQNSGAITEAPDTDALRYAPDTTTSETYAAANKSDGIEAEAVMEAPMYDMADDIDMYFASPSMPNECIPQSGYPQTGEYNTEEYSAISENGYKSVKNEPLSTFSADVDTAAYSNIRRMLLDGYGSTEWGTQSLSEAVRLEEMINYFSYDYPAPDANSTAPFSVTTEYSACPWNADAKLLLIGLQAKEIDMSEAKPSNFVFLVDVSGSMSDSDKLPLVQKAFLMLIDELSPSDRVSVVVYAGSEAVLLEGADGNDKAAIASVIESLTSGGSTHGSAGIKTAYEIARRYFIDGGNNRVILATDGDLNVGQTSESELKSLIEEEREHGVYLSVLGFGSGNLKDNKMETLADYGNGNYYYIDSVLEAKKVLVQQMGGTLYTVAKDVKMQVEFNPEYVKGYRLVGYENRLLNTEDFNDDTKDAGEIGAGHRVTALYEIITADSKMEIPETELKYQSTAAPTGSDELLTVSLRYKQPDADVSELVEVPVTAGTYDENMSENLSFAAAVAQFGMLLRGSDYKGASTYESVMERISTLPSVTADAYKTEFMYLVSLMTR